MIRHVDVVDVPALVKDRYNSLSDEEIAVKKNQAYIVEDDTIFTNLLLTSQKSLRFWAVADSSGHITAISRNLRLNTRFKSNLGPSDHIISMQHMFKYPILI